MFFDFTDVDESMIEKFQEHLPHGSGIDSKWYIADKGKYFRCCNSYHCMTEHGFYDGYADFTIIIDKNDPQGFRLHFNGKGSQYLNYKYMLREYLDDTFAWSIYEIFPVKQ